MQHPLRRTHHAGLDRIREHVGQRPEGATEGILGADGVQRSAVVGDEVMEAPLRSLRIHQKSEIPIGQVPAQLVSVEPMMLQNHDQGACVVICGVAGAEVRDAVVGVLDQPEAVGHPRQVLQRDRLVQLGVGHCAALPATDGGAGAATGISTAGRGRGLGSCLNTSRSSSR